MATELAEWDWPKVLDAEFQHRFAVRLTTEEVSPKQYLSSLPEGQMPSRRQMEFIRGFMAAVLAQQVRGLRQ